MTNPFPGVDPYIEVSGLWPSFHNALAVNCSQLLNDTLPRTYAAMVESRLELIDISDGPERRRMRPDVGIIRSQREGPPPSAGAAVLDIEPAILTLPEYEEVSEFYVNIVKNPGRELVTSIEILSPTNKIGGDYLGKRAAMLQRKINLVEIDLLLDGDRLSTREPLPLGDYFAFISRSNRRPKCDVYGWSIRRTLPKIPIPLKPPDGDVTLDLADAFHRTYERGRFNQSIDYTTALPHNISEADAAWVASQIPRVTEE